MKYCLISFGLILFRNLFCTAQVCERALYPDLKECKKGVDYSIFTKLPGQPSQNNICRKAFNVAVVRMEPYSSHAFLNILDQMLSSCCGKYQQPKQVQTFDTMTDVSPLSLKNKGNPDVVYPVAARANARKVHGYYYLPLINIDGGYLMTGQLTKKMMLLRFVGAAGNLWPLLIIMLLLSILAGFVMWKLDKRHNEDEFSQTFKQGIFDGFWWGFVSMTTVGYGDKSPRSTISRVFSVMWILIGITICGMFTASLTTELQSLSNPRAPKILGSKVGVLKNRFLDLMAVTKEGGEVVESNTEDFIDGIFDLLAKNKRKEIEGIFLDMFAYTHAYKNFSDIGTHHAKKFTERMEVTKVEFKGEPMSYGLMFKNEGDYRYFEDLIVDNKDAFETCKKLGIGMDSSDAGDDMGIFSYKAGFFLWFLFIHIAIIIAVFVYGYFHDKKINTQKSESENAEMEKTDCEIPLA